MAALERILGILEGEDKVSDLERLERIEELVDSGDFQSAISELEKIRKDENVYVGARIIIRALLNLEGDIRSDVLDYLKSLIPIINGISSWRYRSLLMANVAIAFYKLGDEFNGDLALKTAINLAYVAGEDVLVEILRELIRRGMLNKGAYAFSLVKDRRKIDFLLSQLVESLYLAGEYDKARAVLESIKDPFYRAVALYRLALLEFNKNKLKALAFIESAIENTEKIENKHARLELLIKLNDLKGQLTGKGIRLVDILGKESPSPEDRSDTNKEN